MEGYRRKKIADNLKELIIQNKDYTVAQVLLSFFRIQNTSSDDLYKMTDEELSSALEGCIEEFKEMK